AASVRGHTPAADERHQRPARGALSQKGIGPSQRDQPEPRSPLDRAARSSRARACHILPPGVGFGVFLLTPDRVPGQVKRPGKPLGSSVVCLAHTFAAGWDTGTIGISMKLIIALIQPTKLEAVKEALSHVEVFRLTVMDVQGFGRQKGYTEVYRGHEFTVNLL